MQKFAPYIFCLFFCAGIFSAIFCGAQTINDSLLHKVAERFITRTYTLDTIIKSPHPAKNNLPPDQPYSCYRNKEMLVVAVYSTKPAKVYARMLVEKKYKEGIKYDEHFFQEASYDEYLKIHYSIISVLFPEEVTSKNCGVDLQVYDKSNADNSVWLLIFYR